MVTGVIPSSPRFLPSIFIAHRIQQSHCSSIFHRVLLTHALALSASQFVHTKKSQRINTSMHSAGLELTKPTYTRLEDNLIRHQGDVNPSRRTSYGRGNMSKNTDDYTSYRPQEPTRAAGVRLGRRYVRRATEEHVRQARSKII